MSDPDAANREKDVFKEVDRRVRVHMSKDSKLSYKQALDAVFMADRKLEAEYVNTIPPVHFSMTGGAS